MTEILFYGFAALVLVGAIGMLFNERNVAVAGFSFVGSMVAIGAIYVLLDAVFVAALQVVFHAGALAVVLALAGTMLEPRRAPVGSAGRLGTSVMAGVIALLGFAALAQLLSAGYPEIAEIPEGFGSVRSLGQLLLSDSVLAFEFVALLLLSVSVGVVVLARQEAD